MGVIVQKSSQDGLISKRGEVIVLGDGLSLGEDADGNPLIIGQTTSGSSDEISICVEVPLHAGGASDLEHIAPTDLTDIAPSSHVWFDASGYAMCRVVAEVRQAAAAGTTLLTQYCADGVNWRFLDDASNPLQDIGTTGTFRSAWVPMAAGARADVQLRWCTFGGDGTTEIRLGKVAVEFGNGPSTGPLPGPPPTSVGGDLPVDPWFWHIGDQWGTSAAGSPSSGATTGSFVDSVGVNTHFRYTNKPYWNLYATVASRLGELGVKHVRDGAQLSDSVGTTVKGRLQRLHADYGIQSTLIVDWRAFPTAADGVAGVASMASAVAMVEGPNEPDLFYPRDSSWIAGHRAYLQAIHDAVRSTDSIAALPIAGASYCLYGPTETPSYLGDVSAWIDYANFHPYAYPNSPATRDLLQVFSSAYSSNYAPGTAFVATEIGYHTASTGDRPVSEAVQAKYLLRQLMLHYQKGIRRSFIYEFIDEGTSLSNREDRFGLLHNDGSPKPAFTALKNLLTVLGDATSSFVEPAPTYSLAGPASVRKQLLRRSDGTFLLVIWNEVASTDATTSASATLTVGSSSSALTQYVPSASATGVLLNGSGATYSLSVPDELIVIALDGTVVLTEYWPDLSGNGNHLSPVAAAPRPDAGDPCNGRQTLRFQNHIYAWPPGLWAGAMSGEYFVVLKHRGTAAAGTNGSWRHGITGLSAFGTDSIKENFGSSLLRDCGTPLTDPSAAFVLWNVRSTPTGFTANLDDDEQFADATSAVAFSTAPIFGASDESGPYGDFDAAEVIGFKPALSQSDRDAVKVTMSTRWNLGLTLPELPPPPPPPGGGPAPATGSRALMLTGYDPEYWDSGLFPAFQGEITFCRPRRISSLATDLADARSRGFRLLIQPWDQDLITPGGSFNLSAYLATIELYRPYQSLIASYSDVVAGIYVIDEPYHKLRWGPAFPTGIPWTMVDTQMAAKCASVFPGFYRMVRCDKGRQIEAAGITFSYVTTVMNQFYYSTNPAGIEAYMVAERASAQRLGMNILWGMCDFLTVAGDSAHITTDQIRGLVPLARDPNSIGLQVWTSFWKDASRTSMADPARQAAYSYLRDNIVQP